MVALFRRLVGESSPAHSYAPINQDDVTEASKKATRVSPVFFISPAQLWIGSLISRVNKAGEIEQDWLPQFKPTATKLRSLYEPLAKGNGGVRPFLLQFEIGGMLLLGALLEASQIKQNLKPPSPLTCHTDYQLHDVSGRTAHSTQLSPKA